MENATNRYLNALARKLGGVTDYRLAKVLEVSHSSISGYRHGRSSLDNTTAAKVATALALNPLEVIAQIEMDRAKTPEVKAFWKEQAKRMAVVFLVAASILLAALMPEKAFAANHLPLTPELHKNKHYIRFSRMVRAMLRAFARFCFFTRTAFPAAHIF